MEFIRTLLGLKAADKPSHEEEAFNYQLEILKLELDLIDNAVDRINHMVQAIKNWSVVVWGGSIAVLLGVPELRQFVFLTGLVVLPFWISEGRWRSYVWRFIRRQNRISDFLNSAEFIESFRTRQMGFPVLDPSSRFAAKEESRGVSTFASTMSAEVSFFYAVMIVISIGVGLFFVLTT